MTDFAIDPPIRILGRRGNFIRSTHEAAAFIREHMDVNVPIVLDRLEKVTSIKQAQEAAKAFRSWIANQMETTSEAPTIRPWFAHRRESKPRRRDPVQNRVAE